MAMLGLRERNLARTEEALRVREARKNRPGTFLRDHGELAGHPEGSRVQQKDLATDDGKGV